MQNAFVKLITSVFIAGTMGVRAGDGPARRTGIRLGPDTQDTTLKENHIQGFAKDVEGTTAPPAGAAARQPDGK